MEKSVVEADPPCICALAGMLHPDLNTMIQITCINKDNGNHYNRHEGITNFGWTDPQTGKRGNSSRTDMITFLDGKGHAFTKDVYGREAKLYVVRPTGRAPYVQTYADSQWTDNLLALSECRI